MLISHWSRARCVIYSLKGCYQGLVRQFFPLKKISFLNLKKKFLNYGKFPREKRFEIYSWILHLAFDYEKSVCMCGKKKGGGNILYFLVDFSNNFFVFYFKGLIIMIVCARSWLKYTSRFFFFLKKLYEKKSIKIGKIIFPKRKNYSNFFLNLHYIYFFVCLFYNQELKSHVFYVLKFVFLIQWKVSNWYIVFL